MLHSLSGKQAELFTEILSNLENLGGGDGWRSRLGLCSQSRFGKSSSAASTKHERYQAGHTMPTVPPHPSLPGSRTPSRTPPPPCEGNVPHNPHCSVHKRRACVGNRGSLGHKLGPSRQPQGKCSVNTEKCGFQPPSDLHEAGIFILGGLPQPSTVNRVA